MIHNYLYINISTQPKTIYQHKLTTTPNTIPTMFGRTSTNAVPVPDTVPAVSGSYSFASTPTSSPFERSHNMRYGNSEGMSQSTRAAVREINRSLNEDADIIDSDDSEPPKNMTEAKVVIDKLEKKLHYMKLNVSNLEVDVADKTEEVEEKKKELLEMATKLKAWHERSEKLKTRGMQIKIEARISEFLLMITLFYLMFPQLAIYIGSFVPVIFYQLVAGDHMVCLILRASFISFTIGKERNFIKTKLVDFMNRIIKY